MKKYNSATERLDQTLFRYEIGESLLRSEIMFWNDMIESCERKHPGEALERMQQALALAQTRLTALINEHREHLISKQQPSASVLPLEKFRRTDH